MRLCNSGRHDHPRITQRNPSLRILAYSQHTNRSQTQTRLTRRPLDRDQRVSPAANTSVQPLHGNSDIEPNLRPDCTQSPLRLCMGRARPHGVNRTVHWRGSWVRSGRVCFLVRPNPTSHPSTGKPTWVTLDPVRLGFVICGRGKLGRVD